MIFFPKVTKSYLTVEKTLPKRCNTNIKITTEGRKKLGTVARSDTKFTTDKTLLMIETQSLKFYQS